MRTGLLPEGMRLWTVADVKQQSEDDAYTDDATSWKTRPVTISLIRSNESLQTESKRLDVLRQTLHEERAKTEEVARAARFVLVRVGMVHY